MSSGERPHGKRYSHVYIERGEPVYESKRLQSRVGSYVKIELRDQADEIINLINRETGLKIGGGFGPSELANFLSSSSTSDFLEAITVTTWALAAYDEKNYRYHTRKKQDWTAFVDRAMQEENSKFEIDGGGGVHPRIDAAFTSDRVAAVTGLGANRYFTAREHFEASHAALDERPPVTNRAIREIFMANEEVFKLAFSGATKLEVNELQRRAGAVLDGLVTGAERTALNGMIRAADDYIVASHSFRHAQGQPDLPPASMETATFMIGSGTALLRWLIWLDGQQQTALPRPTE